MGFLFLERGGENEVFPFLLFSFPPLSLVCSFRALRCSLSLSPPLSPRSQLQIRKNKPLFVQLTEIKTSSRGSENERRRATEQRALWRRGLNAADAGGGGRHGDR